jgi:hypothetical protein
MTNGIKATHIIDLNKQQRFSKIVSYISSTSCDFQQTLFHALDHKQHW